MHVMAYLTRSNFYAISIARLVESAKSFTRVIHFRSEIVYDLSVYWGLTLTSTIAMRVGLYDLPNNGPYWSVRKKLPTRLRMLIYAIIRSVIVDFHFIAGERFL